MANKFYYQHEDDEDNEQFLRNFEYKEEIFYCDTCENEISEDEYERNNGRCDECNADI